MRSSHALYRDTPHTSPLGEREREGKACGGSFRFIPFQHRFSHRIWHWPLPSSFHALAPNLTEPANNVNTGGCCFSPLLFFSPSLSTNFFFVPPPCKPRSIPLTLTLQHFSHIELSKKKKPTQCLASKKAHTAARAWSHAIVVPFNFFYSVPFPSLALRTYIEILTTPIPPLPPSAIAAASQPPDQRPSPSPPSSLPPSPPVSALAQNHCAPHDGLPILKPPLPPTSH